MISSKVDGHKRQPHNTRAVHSEGDVFGFIEVLWYFPCFEGVHRAHDDQEHVVEQRDNGGHLAGATLKHKYTLFLLHPFC